MAREPKKSSIWILRQAAWRCLPRRQRPAKVAQGQLRNARQPAAQERAHSGALIGHPSAVCSATAWRQVRSSRRTPGCWSQCLQLLLSRSASMPIGLAGDDRREGKPRDALARRVQPPGHGIKLIYNELACSLFSSDSIEPHIFNPSFFLLSYFLPLRARASCSALPCPS